MEVHAEDTDDASNVPSSGGPMSSTSIVGSVVDNVEHGTQTVHSAASMIGPIEGFEPQRTFETAWHLIGGDAVFWEEGFWADLFNPLADPLSSLGSRGLKLFRMLFLATCVCIGWSCKCVQWGNQFRAIPLPRVHQPCRGHRE